MGDGTRGFNRRMKTTVANSLKRASARPMALAAIAWLLLSGSLNAADWPTFGHDPQRSGWAFDEAKLNPQSVANLELKWKAQLKNEPRSLTALTAPVVAADIETAGGIKTLVYVAGSSDHLFALDAKTGEIVWSHDFETHVLPKDAGMWLCPNNVNATPTLDRAANIIYAIATDGRLWGLDLGSGRVKFGPAQFVPPYSKNWSLNLVEGIIYTSLSQNCGDAPSGIYTMEIRHPLRPVVRSVIFDRNGAGVWGRGGPVIGRNGRVYAAAGDGDFDPAAGKFGSSMVAASLGDLKVMDYYAPENFRDVTKYDLDMGASSPVWFAWRDHNLLATGGKEGVLTLLDADSLGARDHQTPLFTARLANDEKSYEGKGVWGCPSYWRDENGEAWVYAPIMGPVSVHAPSFPVTYGPNPHGSVAAFRVIIDSASGKPTLQPAWISADFNVPDPAAIANGVVFALSTGENPQQTQGTRVIYSGQKTLTDAERSANTRHGVLYALDARTGKVLYQSGDAITGWVHFSGLAVADGQVYAVDHDSHVYCFGLK